MAYESWRRLERFLQARDLKQPDGRPLYAYRCSENEFEELVSSMRADVLAADAAGGTDRGMEALFCLIGAEWWRRHHEGGPWKWEGILALVGWNAVGTQRLYQVVSDGLKHWGQRLLPRQDGANAYLVTLACQGGLPLKMIRQESAHLRQYFKQLAERFVRRRTLGVEPAIIAEEVSDALPLSFRNPVTFEMAGFLTQRVFDLQQEIGDSRDPILDLTRKIPKWRERLPINVDDAEAEALLRGLVEDAQRAAALGIGGIRVRRRLRDRDGSLHLEAELICPRLVSSIVLTDLFDLDAAEFSTRMQLGSLSARGGIEPVALLHRRLSRENDEVEYEVEVASRFARLRCDAAAVMAWQIVLRTECHVSEPVRPPGGAELSELPWVFAEDPREHDVFRLLAEGSATTRAVKALIALDFEQGSIPANGLIPRGELPATKRLLFETSGDRTLDLGDIGRFRIRTGAEQDENFEYRFFGARAAYAGQQEIFVGPPSLRIYRDGQPESSLRSDRLEYRTASGSEPWRRIDARCRGRVRLRFADGGSVRFQGRATVVPAASMILLKPAARLGEGQIELTGFDAASLEAISGDGVDLATNRTGRDAWVVSCVARNDETPELRCIVRWEEGSEISLPIPFPSSGTRFVDVQGRTLPNRASVSLEQLPGMRAVGATVESRGHFTLTAVPRSSNTTSGLVQQFHLEEELDPLSDGFFEYELRHLMDGMRRCFALLDDLDAEVRLELKSERGAAIPSRFLTVKLFALKLVLDRDASTFSVDTRPDLSTVEFEALPLFDPQAPNEQLVGTMGTWTVPEAELKSGPWLLLGFQDGTPVARPTLWRVRSQARVAGTASSVAEALESVAVGAESSLTLRQITFIEKKEVRSTAVDVFLGRLAENPSDPDWSNLFALIGRTRELPAVTLDLVKQLPNHPQALTLALFLAPDDASLTTLWRLEEALPFSWELVPFDAWAIAADRYSASLQSLLLSDDDRRRLLARPFLAWPGQRPFAEILRSWLVAESPWPESAANELRLASTSVGVAELRKQLEKRFEDLCCARAGDRWPPGSSLRDFAVRCSDRRHPPWRDLLLRFSDPEWRGAVVAAPLAASLAADLGETLSELALYELERARHFEPNWFDEAYRIAATLALAARRGVRLAPQVDGEKS